ncbi:MAG: hypothetical protein AAF716_13050 [Cyanobacteria bacterium P01_D01_bin.1]
MTQTISSAPKTASSKAPTQPKQRFRRNSFGIRLFSMIMGGAALSIASVAFMFAETVKFQAEDQIQKVLGGKVGTIQEITDRAENLAYSLGVSASTLHVRKAETPETYQELTRQLFESQPSYILGLGFGQKENGILPSLDWFYPYYQIDSTIEEASIEGASLETAGLSADPSTEESDETAARTEATRYEDRAKNPYFYPKSEAYRTYFLPQKSLWTAPYQSDRGMLLTYYSQIYDNQAEWLGTAVVDIDESYLQAVLNEPVFRGGGGLFLLAEDGRVIANPAAAEDVIDQTYADIPGLTEVWPQIRGMTSSGLIEGEGGYWSYRPIADQSWVVVSYVPYRLVFGRIVTISLGAVILAGLLMAGVTALALRYLNKRLRPVINECQRLSTADEEVNEQLARKDELAQLSISFFNLLEQLKLTKAQVQLEAAHATEVETQLKQIKRRAAINQQRQYQNNQPIDVSAISSDELSNENNDHSLFDSSNSSARQLQQELAQLNETVSTLASDNWLVDVLKNKKDGLLPAAELSELNQISGQLDHTFIQVLSALNQFSQLLSAFAGTYEHVLTIEQEMNFAKRDVQTQTEVVDQLQAWAQGHEVFCNQLMRSSQKSAMLTNAHATSVGSESPERLGLMVPTIQSFRQTTRQLSQSLRSLFLEIESIDRKSKQYQRINTAAQVLISNASTLSISASRQRDPEVFDDILSQLRSNGTDLESLAQQLEEAQGQHQQNLTQVENLSVSLRIGMDAVERIAKTLDDLATSAITSQPQQYASSTAGAEGLRSVESQQLAEQLSTLYASLEEVASLTMTTNQYVSEALQTTTKIRQLGAKVPLALPQ